MSTVDDRHVPDGAGVPRAVTEGLFWSWVVNDLEELVTMGPWSRRHAAELARRVPGGGPAWLRDGLTERHVRVAIGTMGVLVWSLARRGTATGGRSRLFRAALLAYGAHGVTHLLNSVTWRGYTPGVLTAPTAVIPYSWWALRRLRRAGLLRVDAPTVALAAVGLPASMFGIHAGTARLLAGLERRRSGAGDARTDGAR